MANTVTQTTLSAAITSLATRIAVASVTNLANPLNGFYQKIYVVDPNQTQGELMTVLAVGSNYIDVARIDGNKTAHASGAIVIINPVDPLFNAFMGFDPNGAPATSPMAAALWLNVTNGHQWIYSSVTSEWVPGFNNPSILKAPTTAVASAAGAILPSGPMFHVTGTAAVTGFTIPVGFAGGSLIVIPDAVFTWTAAGNIALAGTAVVNKTIVFTWDSNAAKFTPSYIA